jgi:hypothetical protein
MTSHRWVKPLAFLFSFILGYVILTYPFSPTTTTTTPSKNDFDVATSPPEPPEDNIDEEEQQQVRKSDDEGVSSEENDTTNNSNGFREPWIEVHGSYFSPEDCEEIIRLAEEHGFPDSSDSIDYGNERSTVSWAIDVFTNKQLLAPTISNMYDKYLPKMFDLVREKKREMDGDDTEPSLDWVFLRKYQAGAERYMLRMHSDTNLFTVNVALNDNFEGGGMFYQQNKDEFFQDDDPIPVVPEHLLTYEFLETLTEHKNQTDHGIIFPNLKQGDMMIHNYTLFHAIAPIQKGTRYSLVFFFDEQHRHVQHNLGEPQRVIIQNMFEMPVDLYWINKNSPELEYVLIDSNIPRDPEIYSLDAARADTFLLKDPQTDEFIFTFHVKKPDNDVEEFFVLAAPDELLFEYDLNEDNDEYEEESYDGGEKDYDEDDEDGVDEEGIDDSQKENHRDAGEL